VAALKLLFIEMLLWCFSVSGQTCCQASWIVWVFQHMVAGWNCRYI